MMFNISFCAVKRNHNSSVKHHIKSIDSTPMKNPIPFAPHPDLRGVFASNLTMAQGAGQAIAENKVSDKIMLIGFDSDDKTVKLLADGNIKALVVQDPFRMGYEGIKTALAASKGEKVPETVDTGGEPHHQGEHEY
jgi:ABC-type xylose transport system substrate-binding protein